MTRFRVEVLPEAETEFREAFLWYFARSPLAADAFRLEVLDHIDGLTETSAGLTMKSLQPAAAILSGSFSKVLADTITTGNFAPRSRRARLVSHPSMPGMAISSRTASGANCATRRLSLARTTHHAATPDQEQHREHLEEHHAQFGHGIAARCGQRQDLPGSR